MVDLEKSRWIRSHLITHMNTIINRFTQNIGNINTKINLNKNFLELLELLELKLDLYLLELLYLL